MVKRYFFILATLFFFLPDALGATRLVTKTADTNDDICDGDCSLREAIAVAQPGDLIQFVDGGIGIQQLESKILINKNNITIDGGRDHTVILRGRLTENVANNMKPTASFDCIELSGSENIIDGLVIQNCRYAVYISGTINKLTDGTSECVASPKKNRLRNNYIGINAKGDAAVANNVGIAVSRGSENIIGPGNVISGNLNNGIGLYSHLPCVSSSPGNHIEGNIIGLSADGTKILGNQRYGIESSGGISNRIGGETAEQRNVISGNKNGEMWFYFGAQFNQIIGNYIGLDLAGKKRLHDTGGITIGSDVDITFNRQTQFNTIAKNFIGANNPGIRLRGISTTSNVIEGNVIGLDADLQPITLFMNGDNIPLGMGIGLLLEIGATQNSIGGETKEKANIFSNYAYGIYIHPQTAGDKLGINSFFDNTKSGIFLSDASSNNGLGVVGDLRATEKNGEGAIIEDQLTLSGTANPAALVDLYVSDDETICEGKKYIRTITAEVDGRWSSVLEGTLNDAGTLIVALQRNETDGFSEFSGCFEIENQPPYLSELDNRGVTELQPLVFNLHAVDVNGNGLSYSCSRGCPEGLVVDAEGKVEWTPKRGEGGKTYDLAFTASDGALTDEKNISILVEQFDTTPQLANLENQKVTEEETLQFNLEATDEDGDPFVFSLAEGFLDGMQFSAQTGVFRWTPEVGNAGTHRLIFRAIDNDKEILFSEKEMQIEVKRKRQPPVIEMEKQKTVAGGQKISLIAILKEPFEDAIYTYQWQIAAEDGKINGEGATVEYTSPIIEKDDEKIVTLRVEDEAGNASEATVTILVLGQFPAAPGGGAAPESPGVEDKNGGSSGAPAGETGVASNPDTSGSLGCNVGETKAGPSSLCILCLLPLLFFALKKRIAS